MRGQEWAAKTDAPEGKIPKNAIVVVEGIQGVKLIVRNGEEIEDMMAAVMGISMDIFLIIVMVVLISCVKIVRQAQALVIERLEHIRQRGEPDFTLNFRSWIVLQEEWI